MLASLLAEKNPHKKNIQSRWGFINVLGLEYASLSNLFTCPSIDNIELTLTHRLSSYTISSHITEETQRSLLSTFVFFLKIQNGFFENNSRELHTQYSRLSNLIQSKQLQEKDVRFLLTKFQIDRNIRKVITELLLTGTTIPVLG